MSQILPFAARAMKSRLFVSAFMFALGTCGVAAESLNPPLITVQEQIAALKKQNQEMHLQIEVLKQQRWRNLPSRRIGASSAPQVVLVTNGKDAKADVQSLRQAIEAMNGRT